MVHRSRWASTGSRGAHRVGLQTQGCDTTRSRGLARPCREEAPVRRCDDAWTPRLGDRYEAGIPRQPTGRTADVAEVEHENQVAARTTPSLLGRSRASRSRAVQLPAPPCRAWRVAATAAVCAELGAACGEVGVSEPAIVCRGAACRAHPANSKRMARKETALAPRIRIPTPGGTEASAPSLAVLVQNPDVDDDGTGLAAKNDCARVEMVGKSPHIPPRAPLRVSWCPLGGGGAGPNVRIWCRGLARSRVEGALDGQCVASLQTKTKRGPVGSSLGASPGGCGRGAGR